MVFVQGPSLSPGISSCSRAPSPAAPPWCFSPRASTSSAQVSKIVSRRTRIDKELWGKERGRNVLTVSSHFRISSSVHPSGSPFGSGCAGNMSPPIIDQAAAAAMAPPNAVICQWVWLLGRGPDGLAFGVLVGTHQGGHSGVVSARGVRERATRGTLTLDLKTLSRGVCIFR